MATQHPSQQGTGKHPHKSTKEPWPHRQGQTKRAATRKPAASGSKQSSAGQAKSRETTSSSEEELEDEASNAEELESEDEQESYVGTLLAIAQMDSEAAMAYEQAAELVSSPEIRAQLQQFAADHRRHIDDLGGLIEALGADAELAAPPPDASVFSMLALAVASLGDRAALMALVANEQFTNATYSTALELVTDTEALTLLERNLQDEQRHISWLSKQTAERGEDVDTAEE